VGIDSRVQKKLINTLVNILLEYIFHSILYLKEEVKKLDVINKKAAKKKIGVSIRCPIFMLFLDRRNREWGLKSLWETYKETNIADLLNIINYRRKTLLYYQTLVQWLMDLDEKGIVKWRKNKKINKETYNKWWIVRAIELARMSGLKISMDNLKRNINNKEMRKRVELEKETSLYS
jgi:hypothetical protein